MGTEFFRLKLSPAWMFVVVAVNFRVAFEAHRNRIINVISSIALSWNNVVRLDLDPTKPVADAATSVTLNKER